LIGYTSFEYIPHSNTQIHGNRLQRNQSESSAYIQRYSFAIKEEAVLEVSLFQERKGIPGLFLATSPGKELAGSYKEAPILSMCAGFDKKFARTPDF
jgi:hypothetical protein